MRTQQPTQGFAPTPTVVSSKQAIIPADAYKTAPVSEPELAPREAVDQHVDTQAGSTALSGTEAWVQTNSRDPHNDGRSHTRTYFNANDVTERFPGGQQHRDPSDRRSWATLAQWQDGVQSDISRGSQNWWADKKRWVNTFAGKMGATEYHEQRCQHVIDEMELTDYQPDRIPAELLIIAVLSLLIDHDIDNPDNFDNRALKRGETEQLLSDIDASVTDYQNARSKIQQRDGDILFPE